MYEPHGFKFIKHRQFDDTTVVKLFAYWRGGYCGSDAWRLNSGCTKIVNLDEGMIDAHTGEPISNEYYEVHGESGSIYKIRNREGLAPSNYIVDVFNKIMKGCDATIITLEEAITLINEEV